MVVRENIVYKEQGAQKISLIGTAKALKCVTFTQFARDKNFKKERYNDLISNSQISLNRSFCMAVNCRIENSIITSDALKGDLYTVQFNETGTVFGASLEGLYYQLRGK